MHADPFGTADLRRRVLAAWAESPARFREDANAEEDLVRGGYRDRLLVELAQNAADAAARAGPAGRAGCGWSSTGDVLRAANTGAPLDDAGVRGLATLRASAKRDETRGRRPVRRRLRRGAGGRATSRRCVSAHGGVRFSARATRAEVAALPGARRRAGPPRGRRPGAAAAVAGRGPPPEGFATEVVLPLRPGARGRCRRRAGRR